MKVQTIYYSPKIKKKFSIIRKKERISFVKWLKKEKKGGSPYYKSINQSLSLGFPEVFVYDYYRKKGYKIIPAEHNLYYCFKYGKTNKNEINSYSLNPSLLRVKEEGNTSFCLNNPIVIKKISENKFKKLVSEKYTDLDFFIYNNKEYFFVEVKCEKDKLNQKQIETIKKLEELGIKFKLIKLIQKM